MNQYKGKLIVHTGSMFSGKTKGLETDIVRFGIANMKTQVFKPVEDDRYSLDSICTHDGMTMKAMPVPKSIDVESFLKLVNKDTDVIGIDEVQFFKDDVVVDFIDSLLGKRKTVVVAGLDMTFEAKPFGIMPYLMATAEYSIKHQAVCRKCGSDAWVSYRTSEEQETVVIGGVDKYIPLCRACYYKELNKK